MLFRFDNQLQPVDLPDQDLRLIDFLTLDIETQKEITAEFDNKFGQFLKDLFPTRVLCRSMVHLDDLYNAYIDYAKAEQAAGNSPLILEEWSVDNGAQYVLDDVSLPHQPVRWFELQSLSTGLRVGALQISQIELVSVVGDETFCRAHVIMTLPDHQTLSFPQYWGEVLRDLIDEEFVDLANPVKSVAFEEWTFPTNEGASYKHRPGNSFGADIIARARVNRILEFQDPTEVVPINLRKRPR